MFAEGIKMQHDSFLANVEEGIRNLEHLDFAQEENASFRRIMTAEAKLLLSQGHKPIREERLHAGLFEGG